MTCIDVGHKVDMSGHPTVVFRAMAAEELISRGRAAQLLKVGTRQLLRYAEAGLLTKHTNPITGRVCYSRRQVMQLSRDRERFVPEKLAG